MFLNILQCSTSFHMWSPSFHMWSLVPIHLNESHSQIEWLAVKILTPSLFCSGVTDPQFVIFLLFLASLSIIALTVHYWPLSIPFQSICSLVLPINIVTLGSSNINYDFILTSYYPSNVCFTQKLSILDYYIVFPILSFHICFTAL